MYARVAVPTVRAAGRASASGRRYGRRAASRPAAAQYRSDVNEIWNWAQGIFTGKDVLSFVFTVLAAGAGSWIAYVLAARTRHRSTIKQEIYDAIAAVARAREVAQDLWVHWDRWPADLAADHDDLNKELARTSALEAVQAIREARSAVSRASAYVPALSNYLQSSPNAFVKKSPRPVRTIKSARFQ
jgi:hypothetical protein